MTIESQLEELIGLTKANLDATNKGNEALFIIAAALKSLLGNFEIVRPDGTALGVDADKTSGLRNLAAETGISAVRDAIASTRPTPAAPTPVPSAPERPRPSIPNDPPPIPTEVEHAGGRPIGGSGRQSMSAPRQPAAPTTARPDMPSLDAEEDPAASITGEDPSAAPEAEAAPHVEEEPEDVPAIQSDDVQRPDLTPRVQGDEPAPQDELRYGQPSAISAVVQINGIDDLDDLSFDKAKSILVSFCGESASPGYRERVDLLKAIYGEQTPAIEGETPKLLKDVDPKAYGNVVRELAMKIAVYNVRNNIQVPDDIQSPAF